MWTWTSWVLERDVITTPKWPWPPVQVQIGQGSENFVKIQAILLLSNTFWNKVINELFTIHVVSKKGQVAVSCEPFQFLPLHKKIKF